MSTTTVTTFSGSTIDALLLRPVVLRPVLDSSVVAAVGYVPLAVEFKAAGEREGVDGFIVVKFLNGREWAYLAESWLVGLFAQERVSAGRLYNRWLKGKRPAVRVV